MNRRVIFVHGYEAYPEKDWFPNIAQALDELGQDYAIPSMPGDSYPHCKDWLEIIDKEVRAAQKPVVLVGFSLGARATLLYIEKYQPSNIDTVILIAAFDNNIERHKMKWNGAYNSFFEYAVDTEKIKARANKFIVMHSKDDPHVPYESGKEIAQELGATFLSYEDRNHFYLPENYTYVLEVLKTVL